MEHKKFGAFTSSVNPEEISLTVSSVVKMLGLLVGGFAALKGTSFAIDDAQLQLISQAATTIIVAAYTIKEMGNILLGVFRKVLSQIYG